MGCLVLILIVTVPPVLAAAYGVWYLWEGYRHNPVYRLAADLVRQDGMTQQVLGAGPVITGVEGNVFSWMPGLASESFGVTLEGPKGEGHLAIIEHHSGSGPPQLDGAILTGPDDRRYDLLKHQELPAEGKPALDTSI
ncbi:MAG TPA: hypothetical protein VGG66_07840 [Rhizomicrobium sp.]